MRPQRGSQPDGNLLRERLPASALRGLNALLPERVLASLVVSGTLPPPVPVAVSTMAPPEVAAPGTLPPP